MIVDAHFSPDLATVDDDAKLRRMASQNLYSLRTMVQYRKKKQLKHFFIHFYTSSGVRE